MNGHYDSQKSFCALTNAKLMHSGMKNLNCMLWGSYTFENENIMVLGSGIDCQDDCRISLFVNI